MKKRSADFDIAIAGAGPGGVLAALRLAEAGYSVGLFDILQEKGLGRSLVLETEPSVYSRVGLDFPAGNMIAYEAEKVRFMSSRGRELFSFSEKNHSLPVAINLDLLIQSILKKAKAAGVFFYPETKIDAPVLKGDRVTGFVCSSGNLKQVNARITIDATGFSALLVRALPAHLGFDFPESSRHIVSAVNLMHRLIPSKADDAINRGFFSSDEIIARIGVAGTYSTVFSFLSKNTGRAYLLAGIKRDHEKIISAAALADDFVKQSECFGKKIRSAAAPIRIRHSLDRLVSDGFMVIGEAACTVFPMHGSGVASALITGSMAAAAAARALSENDVSTAALWSYPAGYQRSRGRRLAAYDAARLVLDSLSENEAARLMEDGIMRAEDTLNGLQINLPAISPGTIPARLRGLARNPGLIPPILNMGITIQRLLTHYAAYPQAWDINSFNAWKKKKKKIFGRLLD